MNRFSKCINCRPAKKTFSICPVCPCDSITSDQTNQWQIHFLFIHCFFIFNNHYQICETLGSQRPSPGVFRTHRDTHAELSTRQISKVPIWSLSHFLQLFVALTEQRRMVDSFQQGHLTVYLPQWPALSLPAARIILESASRCMFVCVWPLMTHTRCCFRLSTTTDCD